MLEIKESIKQNNSVFLRGFGTFLVKRKKKKKTGRNISKNTTIVIPTSHSSFKPASMAFKEEVKNNVK